MRWSSSRFSLPPSFCHLSPLHPVISFSFCIKPRTSRELKLYCDDPHQCQAIPTPSSSSFSHLSLPFLQPFIYPFILLVALVHSQSVSKKLRDTIKYFMPQDVYAVSVAATKVQLPSETHSDNPPPSPLSLPSSTS